MTNRSPILIAFVAGALLAGGTAAFEETAGAFDKASLLAQTDNRLRSPGERVEIELLVEVEPGWHVNSHRPTYDYLIPTAAAVTLPEGWPVAEMKYPEGEMKSFAFSDEPLSVYDGQFLIVAVTRVPEGVRTGPIPVEVTLRYQACDDRRCLPPTTARAQLELAITDGRGTHSRTGLEGPADGGGELPATLATPPAGDVPGASRSIALFLLFGVIGGLLLNAMPCVLPVLSLKLMGLIKSSTQKRRQVVAGSLATSAGILVSFWALAAAAIVARSAGASVGWGVQFQQPVFVTALGFVVVLFCLNLWGLFEVPLPRRIAGWAEAAGSEGLPSHFTAGLFATLMATPCSAPFLGTAVGFALAQTAGVILLTFTAVGLGMALPYLLLAIAPGTLRLLPKPGVWMVHFRHFMGFLLAAAAVWLLYVLSSQVSRERLAFIQIALLALAVFVWIRNSAAGSRTWRWIGVAGALGAVAAGLALASAPAQGLESRRSSTVQKLIPWLTFDRAEAERLAALGSYVFVDVTADWCFTCKVNERLVLETAEIATAFERHGVVPMKADWTNRDDSIARFLADHGKYGIPFYLLYRPGKEPYLFSELLTTEAILTALAEGVAANGSPPTPDRP